MLERLRFAAAVAAMAASAAVAAADAKPMPRERPTAAIPLARPAPDAQPGLQAKLPRRKPSAPSMAADAATGSLQANDATIRHERQATCLAKAIYFEARSEPLEGQFAVARVVLNRAADRRFPDTICKVVYQNAALKDRCQFSFACDGQPDEPEDSVAWALARGMAEALLRVEEPLISGRVLRATHYHADYVAPWWAPKLRHAGQLGRHIFYVRPGRDGARQARADQAAAH